MEKVTKILYEYDVDFERGFLPAQDPLTALPDEFQTWDNLASNLSAYINAGVIREKIEVLPLIEDFTLNSSAELERAMLLLSFFAHAYVHSPSEPKKYIPASIAIPWVKVAKSLNRKPILSHSSAVLNNWKRLDINKPIQLDNLATLCQFHGGMDESWFYLVTVEIEQVGAKAIPKVLKVMEYAAEDSLTKAADCLSEVNIVLEALLVSLKKMYERCDPYIFYLRVRPFLASFEVIKYSGTDLPPQNIHGGSAAQSSLLQFFDAALGMDYSNPSTKEYLLLMRQHMPQKHAAFLFFTEKSSTLRMKAPKNEKLHKEYKAAVQHLINFRNEHLKFVALYIMKQAKKLESSTVGTGGTNPMEFLKSVRNRNIESIL
jgi:indoleamine 2,3-dioxygenase